MHVAIAIFGSRGDVQPALALAVGLQRAGHTALIAAPPNFEPWVRSHGVPFHAVGRDAELILQEVGLSLPAALRMIRAQTRQQFNEHEAAMKGADAIVGAAVHCAGASFAELYGVPYFYAVYAPQAIESRFHCTPFINLQRAPQWVNALSWRCTGAMNNLLFRRDINHERATRGLGPITDAWSHMVSGHVLYAGEPLLAALAPDAPKNAFTTGPWILEDSAEIDPETEAFLQAGPPPVYIGFGSMPDPHPDRTSRVLVDAVEKAGVRALISAGWARLGGGVLPSSIRVLGATPHAKLFPRLAAVVHHGGAGTTGAASRAGVPQLIIPHGFDQYLWGRRVHALGLSPPPINKPRLTVDRLAGALRQATSDSAMRTRATEFASTLTTDGVQRAVARMESVVAAARDAKRSSDGRQAAS